MFATKLIPRAALPAAAMAAAAMSMSSATESALSPSDFRAFKLTKVEPLTHDTKRYTVAIPGDAGLSVASLVMLQVTVDGKKEARPYTPTSSVRQQDSMQFIIKSYPSGKVSKALSEMKAGDEVEVKGPYKKYTYKPSEWTHVGLLAAGTGITPMYQLLQEALADPRDTTKFTLLYANRTPQDIILKEELDALAVVHPNRFKVVYTVDAGKQEEGQNPYKGLKGHFTQATLEENLPKASEADVKIMVCGPPGFYKAYSGEKKSASDQGELSGVLASLGFSPAQVFKY